MKREMTEERHQGPHTVRLKLECTCGRQQTLWVDPDAPVRAVAQAHGWRFVVSSWQCPECLEEANGE